MSDLAALYGALATVIVAAFGWLGLRSASKKPTKTPTLPQDGEPFKGSPSEGINIIIAELGTLRAEVDELKVWKSTFVGAIKRYLTKIALAWSHDDPMPGPDDDDLEIMDPVLPQQFKKG